ncbi:hypothetical protein Pse7367_2427 [Thalassoporum mexicanum PCC 7367]|uniref:hypothetical protein n=1 Tax=Thalassoporum mexicanum TaxID=3457544 RepID=UPI00029F8BF9|nr:hypothetical protein [Pseudanabaena sp. PCC 7367]AFY70688.1 hypothetical protein Pse7367_2427 [Pseudanabaena sp. PCC 7367]
MTSHLSDHALATQDIQVSSSSGSMTVTGNRIFRTGAEAGLQTTNPTEVHLSFEIKQPIELSNPDAEKTETTDTLSLGLSADDAVEVGLQLLMMGMEGKSDIEIGLILERLSHLFGEYNLFSSLDGKN